MRDAVWPFNTLSPLVSITRKHFIKLSSHVLAFRGSAFRTAIKILMPFAEFHSSKQKMWNMSCHDSAKSRRRRYKHNSSKNILKLFPRSIDCCRKALRLLYYSTAHMYVNLFVCRQQLQPSLNHTMSSSLQPSLLAPLCSLLNRLPLILQQLLALLCDHFSLDRQQLQVGESVSEWVSGTVHWCALVCVCVFEWVCLYLFSAFPVLRQLRY